MISALIVLILVAGLTWFFISNLRRKKLKTSGVKQVNFKSLLDQHISYYNALNPQDKIRFRSMVEAFLRDVNIEGIEVEVSDDDRVMVASSAIIPIFGFPEWKYSNLTNVILYPDTFNHDFDFEGQNRNILGMVGSGYMNGQMILSKAALIKGFSRNNGRENAAIHEFVHLTDGADGAIDGVPEIAENQYAEPWLKMVHQEMNKIRKGKSDINNYAATSEAEFLAVASEYFFEKPDKFKIEHPELYEQLTHFFKQEPGDDLV